jgi:hypothetical protein
MLEQYQEALSKAVCVQCLQRNGRGVCSIGISEDCTLNRFLPEIVGIVKSIDSTLMHDYVHELHNVICVSCRENEEGTCSVRGTTGCAVDFYLPLIVDTIKEVQMKEAVAK